MEFILVVAVIFVLCKSLGISNQVLIAGVAVLVELTIIAMLLLFFYFCINLIFTRRKKAVFIRTGKPEGSKFQVAYYLIDGIEYPCIFPCESGISYKANHTYNVLYSKRMNKVYDIWSMLTCIIGFAFSSAAVYFSLQIISLAAIF